MLSETHLAQGGDTRPICVVGAGPVGIALALALAEHVGPVLLLESGLQKPNAASAALSSGHDVDHQRHAAPDVAICRALGGASHWWGGRCVPFDAIDVAPRDHLPEARWPLSYEELSRWHAPAARFFGIGGSAFRDPTPLPGFAPIEADRLERWAPQTALGLLYRHRLSSTEGLSLRMGATVTDLHLSDNGRRVAQLEIAENGTRRRLNPRHVVLAGGGLESTRLLLAMRAAHPIAGGSEGPLGRYYMGHLSGRIADIVLTDPHKASALDFFTDAGVFVRRRFTIPGEIQARERLLNAAFWLDNPPFHAAGHRNGVLSLVWLALAIPSIGRRLVSEAIRLSHVGPGPTRFAPHLSNALRAPRSTFRDLARIVAARYLATPRQPGFLLPSGDGRYALHYHAEHAPNARSRVRLSDRLDPLGLPYLDIDLRFTEDDARSVVRSHEIIDAALRQNGTGQLAYHTEPHLRMTSVLDQARDGFHQIGTARMGSDPSQSVVDANCRVHGMDNLFVASSAVFPSSGQANPTFLAIALALRLADHLRGQRETERSDPERMTVDQAA